MVYDMAGYYDTGTGKWTPPPFRYKGKAYYFSETHLSVEVNAEGKTTPTI